MIGEGKKVTLGNPMINDAAVMAQVVRQTRGPKITMIYKRRRKNSRRKQGHKQDLTLLKIIDIAETGGTKLAPKKAVAKSTDTKAKTETKAKTVATKPKVTEPKVETKAKVTAIKSTDTKPKAETKAKTVATKPKEKKVTGEAKTKAAPINPRITPIHWIKVTFSPKNFPAKALVKIGCNVTINAAIPVGIPIETE